MQKSFQSRGQLVAKIGVLLFGAVIFSLTAFGQKSTYLVKAGEHPAKVLPDTVQFQYPDFQKGFSCLADGGKVSSYTVELQLALCYDPVH